MKLAVAQKVTSEMSDLVRSKLGGKVEIEYLASADTGDRQHILSEADILLGMNLRRDIHDDEYEYLKKVRLIQITLAGADGIPFERFRHEITICSNSGAYNEPIAEHAIGMMLALSRNFLPNHQKLTRGIFDQVTRHKMLSGATLGVIGFGGIGKATAELARGFRMKILAINSTGKTDRQVDFIGKLPDMDYLLRESDFILLSIALNKQTKSLIGSEELGKMKRDAVLVNVARGDLIDERSLYEHLKSLPQFKAGIEAWWVEPFSRPKFEVHYPFFELENFLGSPHNSYLVDGIYLRALEHALENILRYLNGGALLNVQRREDYT